MLPFTAQLIQARWSGEAAWIPFGELELEVGSENHTSHPAPGQLLLYPGGISETEILFPYGKSAFACKDGPLSGTPFLSVAEGAEQLSALGQLTLWQAAPLASTWPCAHLPMQSRASTAGRAASNR